MSYTVDTNRIVFNSNNGNLVYNSDIVAEPNTSSSDSSLLDLNNYVKKSGDIMNGDLFCPNLQTGSITFVDTTIQSTAFTTELQTTYDNYAVDITTLTDDLALTNTNIVAIQDTLVNLGATDVLILQEDIVDIQASTNAITYDGALTKTTIAGDCYVNNLTCGNINTAHLSGTTSNLQTQTTTNAANISTANSKLTGITYDSALTKTTITDNCYLNNLTCGNINTAHLSSTTSNLQTQTNTLNTKTTGITYDSALTKTTITDNCYINNLTCGNINTAHLSGTTSNLQTQTTTNAANISTANSKLTGITYDSALTKTTIANNGYVNNLTCGNINTAHLSSTTSNLQTQTTTNTTNIAAATEKITGITYDSVLTKTSVANDCYVNNLTCGNINTVHLSSTTSNLQTQVNTLNSKTVDITNNNLILKTTIANDCYINNLTCGNIDTSDLTGTSSNVQTQLNTIVANKNNANSNFYIDSFKLNSSLYGYTNTITRPTLNEAILQYDPTPRPFYVITVPKGFSNGDKTLTIDIPIGIYLVGRKYVPQSSRLQMSNMTFPTYIQVLQNGVLYTSLASDKFSRINGGGNPPTKYFIIPAFNQDPYSIYSYIYTIRIIFNPPFSNVDKTYTFQTTFNYTYTLLNSANNPLQDGDCRLCIGYGGLTTTVTKSEFTNASYDSGSADSATYAPYSFTITQPSSFLPSSVPAQTFVNVNEGSINKLTVSTLLDCNYYNPNFITPWFQVVPNLKYPITLGNYNISILYPPVITILFSDVEAPSISEIYDITGQGCNTAYDQSFMIRYLTTNSIEIKTGDSNVAIINSPTAYLNLSRNTGYYKVVVR